jgi:hypothetical protein
MNKQVYQVGDMTQYGVIVEKPFGDGVELIPEFVHHFPDTPTVKLNQFCFVKQDRPWDTEFWCTQDGTWDGKRKMRTGMFTHDAAPYDEAVLIETNWAEDNTFGIIGPLVAVLKDGSQFVAANVHQMRRFAPSEGIVEAKRHRHGSNDATPQAMDGLTMNTTEYDLEKIGLVLINSACIHAQKPSKEFCLARIRGELTVVSDISEKPTLNAPFTWVPLEEFMLLSMDILTQGILGRAIVAGYLKKPLARKVRKVLKQLPKWVAEQTK